MLSKVTGVQGFVFNPRGWCSDTAGLKLQGIYQVFNDDTLQKDASSISSGAETGIPGHPEVKTRQKFKKLCDALLSTAMPPAHYSAKEDLTKFLDEAPEEMELKMTWIKWWDDRQAFIFPALHCGMLHPRWTRQRAYMPVGHIGIEKTWPSWMLQNVTTMIVFYLKHNMKVPRKLSAWNLIQSNAEKSMGNGNSATKGCHIGRTAFARRYHYCWTRDSMKKLIQLVVITQTNKEEEIFLVLDNFVPILSDKSWRGLIASSSVNNSSPSNNFRSQREWVKFIPSKDKRKDQQLMWYLLLQERKPRKNRHCNALRWKKGVFKKRIEVPYHQECAVQSNCYFCPRLECVQQIPPLSNLAIPDKASIKGDVSDAKIAIALGDERPSISLNRLQCVCISEVYKTLPPVRTKTKPIFHLAIFVN